MEYYITIDRVQLLFPVQKEYDEKKLEVFLMKDGKREKIMEFMIPVNGQASDTYKWDFRAAIPVEKYRGETLLLSMEAPEAFWNEVVTADCVDEVRDQHPGVHFAPGTGWMNDPNGLVYADGLYHLYFQYNPFHVRWNNMTWGHAVSEDLLHWKEMDPVMFPDEHGTMFSGSGILNKGKKMGLPETAIIYYYTAAGETNDWGRGNGFTQRIAYSLDGGKTLQKREKPALPVMHRDDRDPKVFYHEESESYIMVLWMYDANYGIFRSVDMENWELSQELTFEGTFECPDLFRLKTEDGENCWFFWTACGNCFPGEFDGYTFKPYGNRVKAYISGRAYAAQTWSNTADRVISVPWLRLDNDGRNFTSAQGIPVEFSARKTEDGYTLIQKPVRELEENLLQIDGINADETGMIRVNSEEPVFAKFELDPAVKETVYWMINGTGVSYCPSSGELQVGEEKTTVGCGLTDVQMLVDDKILELFMGEGRYVGAYQLENYKVSMEFSEMGVKDKELYTVR